jgi:uroporphyrinogen-III decarboxylase
METTTMPAIAAMTVSERFHAVCDGQPVDRLPMVEWASWWDQTMQRWQGEGLAESGRDEITRHFGLDLWHQTWTCAAHWDCPYKAPHHGAGLLGVAPSYDAVEPFVGRWPVDRPGLEHAFAMQQAGEAAVWVTLPGFFWGARDILGIERHLMSFHDEPDLLHRINGRLADWMLGYLDEVDALGRIDFVTFAEDLSYNHGPMLSQKSFDAFLTPYYQRVVPALRRRGIRVVVDSDGDVTRCAPWFAAAGVEGMLPLERQAGVDIDVLQRNHPDMLFVGHFDKMSMQKGEDAMRAEFERLLPAMRRGRFIPSVDHQTPPGVSLAQYHIYLHLLGEYARRAAA